MKFTDQIGKVTRTKTFEKVAFLTLEFDHGQFKKTVEFVCFKDNIKAVAGLELGNMVQVSGTIGTRKDPKTETFGLQAIIDEIEFFASKDDSDVPF